MAKLKLVVPEGGQATTVTVTQDIPNLEVIADGADTPVPAYRVPIVTSSGESYMPVYRIGDRAQAYDQSPLAPILTSFG